ncbi:MAG: PhnD/SsuA/transferrin family substrate-binding protein [Planctomycetes bacterium]|nr:PhnD/SsuA/transferrin family substrate-binding protein [Planctomycetota bacterium]
MVKLRESAEGLGAAIAAHNQPVASYHLKHLELTLQALRQEHGAMGALAQEKLGASMSALRVALEDAEWPDVEQKHESLIASCTSCHPPPWRDGIAPVGSASALGLARSRLRLGVLAAEGEQATRERWEPLAEYLAATLQVGVELVPLGFDAVGPALAQSRLDFLLTNPASFARYRERYGLRLLTTLLSRREGEGYALFGGLLVMREDEVRALKDLKGLRLAAVDPGSLGGWRLQRAELLAAGVDPERDLEVSFHSTHDAVLLAVQDGEADVGAVRTGTLSDMIARGKLAPGGLRVLGGERNLYTEGLSGKDFPFPLSTRLVPQWPLCANPDVPEELSLEVAKALLNLRHTDPACRAAKIQGFGLPRDYSLVQQLVAEQDGVGPAPTGWRSAARALRPPLVLDGVLLIALGLAIVGLLRRGTALRAQRDAALGELERDPLTGLLTARSLAREFARVRSSGQPGQELALLHVDLDGFRETCTTFGSEVAEAVLRHVAGRLAEAAPQTSLHRLRGDELILLTSAKPAEVESLVERLLEEIARPIRLGERLVVQKATVGVALAPLEDARLPSLLDRAGAAMARAKLTHRGAFLIAGEGSPSDPEGETGTGIDDEPLRFMRSRQSTPTKLPSGNTLMVKAPPPDPDLSTSLGGPTEVMDLSEGEAQE